MTARGDDAGDADISKILQGSLLRRVRGLIAALHMARLQKLAGDGALGADFSGFDRTHGPAQARRRRSAPGLVEHGVIFRASSG